MAYFPTNVLDNQIKALPTIDTASGSIATFTTDKAERLVSCVCEVASGASEINVSACGHNLFGGSYDVLYSLFIKGGTTITASAEVSSGNPRIVFYDKNQIQIDFYGLASGLARRVRTFTLPEDTYYFKFAIAPMTNMQIEIGSTDGQTYQAYNGNTYNIQLGETLTDTATYNAVTGVLTRNDTTTKQLDSCPIVTIANSENNIWSDTGDVEVQFVLSVGSYVNQNV